MKKLMMIMLVMGAMTISKNTFATGENENHNKRLSRAAMSVESTREAKKMARYSDEGIVLDVSMYF